MKRSCFLKRETKLIKKNMLTGEKTKRAQVINIKSEREKITTESTEIQKNHETSTIICQQIGQPRRNG